MPLGAIETHFTALSILLVAWMRPELGQRLDAIGLQPLADSLRGSQPQPAFPWFYPVNAAITFIGACLPRKWRKNLKQDRHSATDSFSTRCAHKPGFRAAMLRKIETIPGSSF